MTFQDLKTIWSQTRQVVHTQKKDRQWQRSNPNSKNSQPKIFAKWHFAGFKITNGHSLFQIHIHLRIQRLLTFCELRPAQGPLQWRLCRCLRRSWTWLTAVLSLCFHQVACWTVDFHLGNHGRQIVHQSVAQRLLNGRRNPDISTAVHRSLIAMVRQHSHANHQKASTNLHSSKKQNSRVQSWVLKRSDHNVNAYESVYFFKSPFQFAIRMPPL